MLDSTTDDAMLERIHADAPGSLEFGKPRKRILRQTREALTNVRPADLADPALFDVAGPAADAVLRHNDPENP